MLAETYAPILDVIKKRYEEMERTIIILKGFPGSGKSTFCKLVKSTFSDEEDVCILTGDTLRFMIFPEYGYDADFESNIRNWLVTMFDDVIENLEHRIIIVDDLHHTTTWLNNYSFIYPWLSDEFFVLDFDNLTDARRRNNRRGKRHVSHKSFEQIVKTHQKIPQGYKRIVSANYENITLYQKTED